MELDQQIAPDTGADVPIIDGGDSQTQPRDFDTEAKRHGWTPKEEFRGDPARWVDAETFVKRADEVMPFLKKKTEAQDREIADLKRTIKQAAKHYEAVEERAVKRAMAELEAKHTDAAESGDVVGAKRAMDEIRALEKEVSAPALKEDAPDPDKARKELNDWVGENDWYVLDDKKRAYADLQADLMGKAIDWDGGQKAWLEELGKRVERRFAEKKPSPVSGGGNRSAPGGGGKSYADLPAAAKAACDRFVKNGIVKDREAYIASYDFGA